MSTRLLWFGFWGLFVGAQQEEAKPADNVFLETPGSIVVLPDGQRIIEDHVKIGLPGSFLLTADRAVYHPEAGTITASGNVKIDIETELGLVEVTAREINYYLDSLSGDLSYITIQFGDDFYFVGDRLEILDQGRSFLIENGTLTACNQPTAQWSIQIRKATVEKEGYAFIKGAKFRLKNLPVLYFPYLIVPAMQERRSGLLIPETGRSDRNGAFYSQPIFWAPRQDLDFTFAPGYYDKAGAALGLESRYKPAMDFTGIMNANYYWDDVLDRANRAGTAPVEDGEPLDSQRYRLRWDHRQSVFDGQFRVKVDAGSDFSVDRDFLRDTEKTRVRDYLYRVSYDKDYGRNALLIDANRLQRILARGEAVQEINRLPEVRFYQPNRHLGRGFFLRNYAYAALFDLEDAGPALLSDDLQRLGLDSEISRTHNLTPFVHTRWGVGYKGAYYRRDGGGPGETKGGFFGFLETVGPRLKKNYAIGTRRLVHVLDANLIVKLGRRNEEPFLDGIFLDDLDIGIDEQQKGFQTAWKLNSRFFLGRPGRLRPVLEVEMTQDVDLDASAGESNQPIDTRFRLLNWNGFHANGIFEYNPDRGSLDTLSVYGGVNRGGWQGYGGYVKRTTGAPQESFIGFSEWQLRSWQSRFRVALDYDFENQEFKSQQFSYAYTGQCVSFLINYVKSPFDSRRLGNRDFIQITFSLKNLGDLGTKF